MAQLLPGGGGNLIQGAPEILGAGAPWRQGLGQGVAAGGPPVPTGAIWGVQGDLVTLTSGVVSTWQDVIGANNLTQATAGKRPTVTANAFGTHQGVTTDGISQYMQNTSLVFTQPYTVYLVAKITAPGTGIAIFVDGGTVSTMECYCSPTATGFYTGGAPMTGGAAPSGAAEAYAFVGNSPTSSINRNNTILVSGNPGASNTTGVTVGCQQGSLNFCAATFGCIYIVSGADSFATQQANLRRFAAYYAVSGVA